METAEPEEQPAFGQWVRKQRVAMVPPVSLRELSAAASMEVVRVGEIERGVGDPLRTYDIIAIRGALNSLREKSGQEAALNPHLRPIRSGYVAAVPGQNMPVVLGQILERLDQIAEAVRQMDRALGQLGQLILDPPKPDPRARLSKEEVDALMAAAREPSSL